jgi:hypothetical protein
VDKLKPMKKVKNGTLRGFFETANNTLEGLAVINTRKDTATNASERVKFLENFKYKAGIRRKPIYAKLRPNFITFTVLLLFFSSVLDTIRSFASTLL